MANADSEACACINASIDATWRVIGELPGPRIRAALWGAHSIGASGE
jgi:hypothetical protein